MASMKPSIPKGTRDFSPEVVAKRNFIFNTIRSVFHKHGFQPIETPCIENLSTLEGKYGEEGDKLLYKIRSNKSLRDQLPSDKAQKLDDICPFWLPAKSELALRYDLTVPFARYVVMHQHALTLPFKRYQIQPVWRADRPQRGRYREFWQCDADVVGSDSLLNELEFIQIYDQALSLLGLKDFSIKINNRKILGGVAGLTSRPGQMMDMTIALDKLDKIGTEGVIKELEGRGFSDSDIEQIKPFLSLSGSRGKKLELLKSRLNGSPEGARGIKELETLFRYLDQVSLQHARVELDLTLARGLNYYTGTIFEVKSNEVQMSSIGGGGRYDDLTGMFGLKGLTGAGISFGADRIYDVLEALELFPESAVQGTRVLITNFDEEAELYALPVLQGLRNAGVVAELYPERVKLAKQFKYANARGIPYVLVIGTEEMQSGELTLRDMQSGEQWKMRQEEIYEHFTAQ